MSLSASVDQLGCWDSIYQFSSLYSILHTVLEGAVLGKGHMIVAAKGKGKTKDQHIVLVSPIEYEFYSNRTSSPS